MDEHLPQLCVNYRQLYEPSLKLDIMPSIQAPSEEATRILDTTQYKPSLIVNRLQYLTENNVIRLWKDDIISGSKQCSVEDKKMLN